MKKWIGFLLALLLVMTVLPLQAFAIEPMDLQRDVTLTIHCMDGDKGLEGAEFRVYRVADTDEFAEMTPTAAFAKYVRTDLNNQSQVGWEELAYTLEKAVLENDMAPMDHGKTNAQGTVKFPCTLNSLKPGLYLVVGVYHSHNYVGYIEQPVLVMLPHRNQTGDDIDSWHYDVERNAKHTTVDEEIPVAVEVQKVWKDSGYQDKRPEEITVKLYRDKKIFDEVKLNPKNQWYHKWENLEPNHTWSVDEEYIKGYEKKIESSVNGDRTLFTFKITNTYIYPGKPPQLPQTGQLWWPVPVLLSAGLLMLLVGLIRRRGGRHEE